MDQPLGLAIGNALEVAEAIEVLKGAGPTDLAEHSNAVAAEMLLLAGAATTIEEARAMARRSLDDGSALAKFRELIAAQGGDPAIVDDPGRLPAAPLIETLRADRSGFIALMDAAEFGYAVVDLGGGRAKKGDAVDPAVGIMLSDVAKIGNFVEAGTPLLQIHASDSDSLARAKRRLAAAISISDRPEAPRPVVHRVIR
jgi:pyrimidine-nucleoside phosphorylase